MNTAGEWSIYLSIAIGVVIVGFIGALIARWLKK